MAESSIFNIPTVQFIFYSIPTLIVSISTFFIHTKNSKISVFASILNINKEYDEKEKKLFEKNKEKCELERDIERIKLKLTKNYTSEFEQELKYKEDDLSKWFGEYEMLGEKYFNIIETIAIAVTEHQTLEEELKAHFLSIVKNAVEIFENDEYLKDTLSSYDKIQKLYDRWCNENKNDLILKILKYLLCFMLILIQILIIYIKIILV